ncbi:ABC transporter [Phytophthora megakarya]|uniref:ABC transporter n=1 Tax=Phytophthora megakarya TaxID=4795 RepID=A0A225VXR8_9STRA|nr:ABC transporter [Phytophthora megakarya]
MKANLLKNTSQYQLLQHTEHNHALDSRSYGNHPSNRRVEDEAMIDFVDELQAAGAKKKLILQFLKKKTGAVTDFLFDFLRYS